MARRIKTSHLMSSSFTGQEFCSFFFLLRRRRRCTRADNQKECEMMTAAAAAAALNTSHVWSGIPWPFHIICSSDSDLLLLLLLSVPLTSFLPKQRHYCHHNDGKVLITLSRFRRRLRRASRFLGAVQRRRRHCQSPLAAIELLLAPRFPILVAEFPNPPHISASAAAAAACRDEVNR